MRQLFPSTEVNSQTERKKVVSKMEKELQIRCLSDSCLLTSLETDEGERDLEEIQVNR